MFGFNESKTYCFHISNFKEIQEGDEDIYERLEHGILEHYAFTEKLDSVEGVFCIYMNYKKDLLWKIQIFHLKKFLNLLKVLG